MTSTEQIVKFHMPIEAFAAVAPGAKVWVSCWVDAEGHSETGLRFHEVADAELEEAEIDTIPQVNRKELIAQILDKGELE